MAKHTIAQQARYDAWKLIFNVRNRLFPVAFTVHEIEQKQAAFLQLNSVLNYLYNTMNE